MLITKIRTGIKSPWAKGLLFFFFIALFGGFGITTVVRRIMSGKTDGIAMVNGEEVSRNFFLRKRHEAQEQITMLYRRFGQSASAIMNMQGINQDPTVTALNESIQETLLNQVANKIPVHLSSEYVAAKLQDPYFLVGKLYHLMPSDVVTQQGKVNIESFNRFIASYDLAPLENDIEQSLRHELALSLVANSFWSPQFIQNDLITSQTAQRKFSIVTIPFEQVEKQEKERGASDEEVRAFFDKMSKFYYTPARRGGMTWAFEPKDFNITIKAKEIENYYSKVKYARFVDTPAQVKIRQIIFNNVKEKGLKELERIAQEVHEKVINDPTNFSTAAQECSEDLVTAKNGGLVDFFKRGSLDNKEIERVAFRLKTNGDISEVIKLENGYAIIQRVARKEAVFKPLEKVKGEIATILQEKKFNTEFQKAATKIIRAKENSSDKFDEFVAQHKGSQSKVEPVKKEDGGVSARLFALKKAGDKVAYISNGKGYILELKNILKKSLPPFDMIKNTVEKDLYKDRARKTLETTVHGLRKEALSKNELVAPQGGKIKTTDWIDGSDQKKLKAMIEEGVPREITLLDKVGGITSSINAKGGFVVRLDSMKDSDKKKEETTKLASSLQEQLKGLFTGAFMASLNRYANIDIDLESNQRNDIL